jgi:hypothetical protein
MPRKRHKPQEIVARKRRLTVTAFKHRRQPRPDASGPWGGKSRGGNRAPKSTRSAKAARIGPWTKVQQSFPAEISRRTCPQVDGEWSEEQGFGCRPSPYGECRLSATRGRFLQQGHGARLGRGEAELPADVRGHA